MDKDEVQELINQSIAKAIKSHEIRVGLVSGLIGLAFILGIMHSIWLIRHLVQY